MTTGDVAKSPGSRARLPASDAGLRHLGVLGGRASKSGPAVHPNRRPNNWPNEQMKHWLTLPFRSGIRDGAVDSLRSQDGRVGAEQGDRPRAVGAAGRIESSHVP